VSQRNGDRSRFQINRKRKLRRRERIRALTAALVVRRESPAAASAPEPRSRKSQPSLVAAVPPGKSAWRREPI